MMQNRKTSNDKSSNGDIKVTDDGASPNPMQNQAQKLAQASQNEKTTAVLDHPSLTAALLQAAKDLQAGSNTGRF